MAKRKLMKKTILLTAVVALAMAGAACDKLKARDQLNRGVESYKNAKYGDAIDHFQQSIQLDPSNPNPRLYLATTYMQQYIPGADSPDNKAYASHAKEWFQKVLNQDSSNKQAVKMAVQSLASLSFNEVTGMTDNDQRFKKLDEAKDWNEKLIQIDPNSKEAYYTLGVIDWTKWYPNYTGARNRLGMRLEDPGPFKDKKVRAELKEKYGPLIEDGIKNLQKALEIDPQYDDAMSYMNLLIRERADLEDDSDGYKRDIDTANGWMNKAMETKKIKGAKAAAAAAAASGGITTEEQK